MNSPPATPAPTLTSPYWVRWGALPIVLATLATVLATAVAVLVQLLQPATQLVGQLPLFFLAGLLAAYTTLWLGQEKQRQLNHPLYRATELFLLLLLARLYVWLWTHNFPPLAAWPDLLARPYRLLNDLPFVAGAACLLLSWGISLWLASQFAQLALDASERHYYALPNSERTPDQKPMPVDRYALFTALRSYWLVALFGLVLLSSVLAKGPFSLDLAGLQLSLGQSAHWPLLLASLLLYVAAGLWLLSQAWLAVLEARWLGDGVGDTAVVKQRWQRHTQRLLLALALLALLTPIGPLQQIGRWLGPLVATAVAWLGRLADWLAAWLAGQTAPQNEMPIPPTPMPQIEQSPNLPAPLLPLSGNAPMQLPANLESWLVALGWLLFVALLVTAVRYFWQNGYLGQNWHSLAQWRSWWQQWWHGQGRWRDDLPSLQAATTKENKPNRRWRLPWPALRLGNLPPQEQVRYLYLQTVQRAGQSGLKRQAGQTPTEFAQTFKQRWPETAEEIEQLTAVFLQARYGRQPIEKQTAVAAKQLADRLKSQLRQARP